MEIHSMQSLGNQHNSFNCISGYMCPQLILFFLVTSIPCCRLALLFYIAHLQEDISLLLVYTHYRCLGTHPSFDFLGIKSKNVIFGFSSQFFLMSFVSLRFTCISLLFCFCTIIRRQFSPMPPMSWVLCLCQKSFVYEVSTLFY